MMKPITLLLMVLLSSTIFFESCKKDSEIKTDEKISNSKSMSSGAPTVTTNIASSITSNTALSGGTRIDDGGYYVIHNGVCWSTSPNPTIANNFTSQSQGSTSFISSITGLAPLTKYYVRAYATNTNSTGYGNEISFTTLSALPTLTTKVATSISSNTASSGGNRTYDGGYYINLQGVCWSTSPNPTITNNCTSQAPNSTNYNSTITGLAPLTTYYVRAYARNTGNYIGYGNEINFTTSEATAPILTTTIASLITSSSATSGGNISNDGGSPVTVRGVCWNIEGNPTTALSTKTIDGTGTGSFTSSITGLTLGTYYSVRAYATNGINTSYGNEIRFRAVKIGDTYQGGKIAYIFQPGEPGYVSGATYGIIAATSDQSSGIIWCNGGNGNAIPTCSALHCGNINTFAIVNKHGAGTYAAKLCGDLVLNGYADWSLPSKDELNKLYINKAIIGGFAQAYYWSSTEDVTNFSYAHVQNFYNGSLNSNPKDQNSYVRAIRYF